jgi:hypothetical protein
VEFVEGGSSVVVSVLRLSSLRIAVCLGLIRGRGVESLGEETEGVWPRGRNSVKDPNK